MRAGIKQPPPVIILLAFAFRPDFVVGICVFLAIVLLAFDIPDAFLTALEKADFLLAKTDLSLHSFLFWCVYVFLQD